MALTNKRPKRKVSGGRYISYRKKRVKEIRRLPVLTKLGETIKRVRKTLGGNQKEMLLSAELANVYDPKSKKMKVVKIKSVLENSANRHFVRRNIITKGTVIDTEAGKAKVTSRPCQEGTVNATLI
ncbi:30S ribosomal protein S8e [Candidatus Woesearchaeota archaeon CG10_big_fil_rev_8_21_14_0_10_34_8]|nr:MAG: 30S ribosomal protein S8e [Candidatus Woesearchaeota archaeon CG10_big_fil_rev_8_21_14_0_10_34_8]